MSDKTDDGPPSAAAMRHMSRERIAELTRDLDLARAALRECILVVQDRWAKDEAGEHVTDAWRADRLADWRAALGNGEKGEA